jgi:hypothetical protein
MYYVETEKRLGIFHCIINNWNTLQYYENIITYK